MYWKRYKTLVELSQLRDKLLQERVVFKARIKGLNQQLRALETQKGELHEKATTRNS